MKNLLKKRLGNYFEKEKTEKTSEIGIKTEKDDKMNDLTMKMRIIIIITQIII